jgi:hypothetical protein
MRWCGAAGGSGRHGRWVLLSGPLFTVHLCMGSGVCGRFQLVGLDYGENGGCKTGLILSATSLHNVDFKLRFDYSPGGYTSEDSTNVRTCTIASPCYPVW